MTSFILLQNVQYEGSSLKGVFASLEAALDYLDSLDGYYITMAEWTCDRDNMKPLDDWELSHVANATGGWCLTGPADVSFTIYACAFGGGE